MAFAGDLGIDLDLPVPDGADVMGALFAEEPSMVVEVRHTPPALSPTPLALRHTPPALSPQPSPSMVVE
eukprot:7208869-Prymnesium_polylepis.1